MLSDRKILPKIQKMITVVTDEKENEISKQSTSSSKRSQDETDSRMAEITTILGGDGQSDSGTLRGTRTSKSEQESQLKKYAEQNNVWFISGQTKEITSEKLPSGKETDGLKQNPLRYQPIKVGK